MKRYRLHQLVVLKADKKEGWPKEIGLYLGGSNDSGEFMCVVQLLPQYVKGDDDGIREIEKRYTRPITKRERDRLNRRPKLTHLEELS